MILAVVHGFILAFGLILPLGVQNVFVFNQGATQPKYTRALPVVLTASLCDTLLISLAVLGVSAVLLGFSWLKVVLLSAGIVFLIYMGYVMWKSRPNASDEVGQQALTAKKQIAFAASVSLLNPHAIMDTVGVIGTSSVTYAGIDKAAFTLACIVTSWIWFFMLAFAGRQVGKLKQAGRFLTVLNKLSALIMWGTAIYLLYTLIRG